MDSSHYLAVNGQNRLRCEGDFPVYFPHYLNVNDDNIGEGGALYDSAHHLISTVTTKTEHSPTVSHGDKNNGHNGNSGALFNGAYHCDSQDDVSKKDQNGAHLVGVLFSMATHDDDGTSGVDGALPDRTLMMTMTMILMMLKRPFRWRRQLSNDDDDGDGNDDMLTSHREDGKCWLVVLACSIALEEKKIKYTRNDVSYQKI